MYLAVSGVEVNVFVPPLVAFVVSFFTSMGGVSGAFLLLPIQMSLFGVTAPSVTATNHLFNVIAIPAGIHRIAGEGRLLWPLALVIALGSLPGALLGAWLRISFFPDPTSFRLFAGLILLLIGLRLVLDILTSISQPAPSTGSSVSEATLSARDIKFHFAGSSYSIPLFPVALFSVAIGVLGGIYGIGGGAFIAPFLVAVFRVPVYTVAGASLFGTLVTSTAAVCFYQLLATLYPGIPVSADWRLGLLFGLGGCFGIYLGSRVQKHVPVRIIKLILCFCALAVAVRYILQFLKA